MGIQPSEIPDAGGAATANAGTEDALPSVMRMRGAEPTLGRYELRRELGRGTTGIVYEAWDTQSKAVVALKTLTGMDAENLFRLKHEFRSLANLEHENFVRFGELGCEFGRWFFTMERIEGVDWLAHVRPADRAAGCDEGRLRAALAQLVEGLAALHEAGRIHRDVKPSNVLVSTEGRVVLLDFGLMAAVGAGAEMSGTPLFMAPEQIACEPLTAATDWYAVGVMLHAALTGKMPFDAPEVGDMLSEKLTAEAPTGWGGGLPEDLVSLGTALMAREPRNRPSVDEIRERLGLSAPGGQPRAAFVGRQRELARLHEALRRASTEAVQIVVRGEPGMGKSALVEHFLSGLPAHVVVLRGRCYEQESVPFGGADSLVDALSDYLVGLPAPEAERLLSGGVSGAAKLFPVLHRVPSLSKRREDGPMPNPTRLREQAFAELAKVVGAFGRSRTLVVYVDDLQWADQDSVALMRAVFVGGAGRCLFVATQRSGDRGAGAVEAFAREFDAVEVTTLGAEESQALCAALGTDDDAALRETVLQESGGHPLFLSELLRSARTGKLAKHANARLEDVLWERITDRDEIEQRFLRMVALAGAPTPYTVIAQAAGLDVGECSTRLSGLRAAQLIRVSRQDAERCVEPYHDRIREAAMQRVQAEGATAIEQAHLALGRALLGPGDREDPPPRLFAALQHLNAGRLRIDSDRERGRLAELNLLGSREAHRATAFERACEYARTGIECAGGPSPGASTWQDLHIAQLRAQYVMGRQAEARAAFDAIKASLDPVEGAPAYCAMIDCLASDDPARSFRLGQEALARLGAPLPRRATKPLVLAEVLRTRAAQGTRSAGDLEKLPDLDDRRVGAILQLLTSVVPAAYMVDETLMPWIMLRLARLSLTHGLSNVSSFGFAGYGLILSAVFRRHEAGLAFGRLALRLDERFRNTSVTARIHFVMGGFLLPYTAPWTMAIDEMMVAYGLAAKWGDTTYEGFATGCLMFLLLGAGVSLDRLAERAAWAMALGEQRVALTQSKIADALGRYAAALRGETTGLQDLGAARQSYEEFRRSLSHEFVLAFVALHLGQAELAFLARDLRQSRHHLAQLDTREDVVGLSHLHFEYVLIRLLTDAREYDEAPAWRRARLAHRVLRGWRTLADFARSCPANFESGALTGQAELLRILGRSRRAMGVYARAIASAVTHGSAKRHAIAAELAAELARAQGDSGLAARYHREAIEAYRRWGATAKADLLEAAGREP